MDRASGVEALHANLRSALPELIRLRDQLAADVDAFCVYRFLHGSFKVFSVQSATAQIVAALESIAPEGFQLSEPDTLAIFESAVGHEFTAQMNRAWTNSTLPIVNGYLYARKLLDIAVSASGPEITGGLLTEEWATVLYLYGLR